MNRIKHSKSRFYHTCSALLHSAHGVATVEFALLLPLLITLLFGSIEVARMVLITQKIEKVSSTLSDVTAQYDTITSADLNQIITAAGQVMQPYSFSADGYAIISSVSKTGSASPVINWQYTGGGSYTQTSRIGSSGGVATLPSGFSMVDKDTVIIAEVFYRYNPILNGMIYSSSQLYRVSIYKPRLGSLTTLSWNILPHGITHTQPEGIV